MVELVRKGEIVAALESTGDESPVYKAVPDKSGLAGFYPA
jgi:hypothetical protein